MADKINQEVLDQLLVEVTSEIAEYLRKDEADLRKAADEDDESAAPAEESEGSEGPAAPAEASAPEGSEAPPAEGAPAESPQMDEASAAPEGSAPHEGGEIEPAPTVEGLQAEYMKLDPEALKMHYLACKSALMAQMGAGPEASAPAAPEASAPPAAPPAASAPAAPPAAPEASAPMAMGEMKSSGKQLEAPAEANGGEISAGSKLGKSEVEVLKEKLAKAEANSKEQEAQLLELAMKLTAPLRKSIKGVSELAFVAKEGSTDKKSPVEGLSKNEIVAKLRDKARGDLKKSDRELITAYTMGNVDVSKIEHLLVEQTK